MSNSLVWLEGKQKDQNYQIALVKKLGSKAYMNTNTSDGTGTRGLMRGVKQYAEETWSHFHRLEYAGWRSHLKGSKVADKPTIKWIVDGLHDRSAVWINVGWHVRKGSETDPIFERTGGHWLTVVGHANGKLIFHDPAPRGGMKPKREKAMYEFIEPGTQAGKKRGLPIDAKGSIALTRGMRISKKADIAIIDGAVIFELEAPEPFRTWATKNGKYTVSAKLIDADSEEVKLQTKNNGKLIGVPIEKLSEADQKYINESLANAVTLLPDNR